ncbi:MAG TPA: hypothetical protein VGN17_03840 [Bryobacteraceae bacterium]|jgi:hypothetical protein
MAKPAIDEVEVLRFFETESLEKASVLFNIVADKMRARVHGDSAQPAPMTSGRRRSKIGKIPDAPSTEQTPTG